MPEVVGTFSSSELWYERANCPVETRNGSLCGLAQKCFEFAVVQLDRVEIRRVFRQIAERRPRFLDCRLDAGNFVGCKVVCHDDVIALERGNQALLDVGQEHLSVHGSLDHHRSGDFVVAQGGHESDRLPFSKWNAVDQPDAMRSTPSKPHQISADCSLVDKHQTSGIKHALLPDPASARTDYIRPLP